MTKSGSWTPPKVWKWESESGGRFARINRPIAGPSHDEALTVGRHPHQRYSLATPNGVKLTRTFEELLARGIDGAEYERVAMEAKRRLDVLDRHLAEHEYMAGSDDTIADMAIWAGYGQHALGRLGDAAEFLQVDSHEHVPRWAGAIDARPAVRRGRMVNRSFGDPEMQLHERRDARDFETKTQDKVGSSGSQD